MGLNFSHCKASWSYAGFMNFRNKIIHGLGETRDLNTMYEDSTIEEWKDHDLYHFLNHSDCDGKLTPEEMKKIIPAMNSIIKNWRESDYDRQHGELLISGMKKAIKQNEVLAFL